MCCIRRFVPLTLAWATTIHKCQGTEAGKTEPPRPPNPCKRVIVDMGNTGFEKRTPGVAYVAMSRANTLERGISWNQQFILWVMNLQKKG